MKEAINNIKREINRVIEKRKEFKDRRQLEHLCEVKADALRWALRQMGVETEIGNGLEQTEGLEWDTGPDSGFLSRDPKWQSREVFPPNYTCAEHGRMTGRIGPFMTYCQPCAKESGHEELAERMQSTVTAEQIENLGQHVENRNLLSQTRESLKPNDPQE